VINGKVEQASAASMREMPLYERNLFISEQIKDPSALVGG